jgi:hypothetical protein
MRIAKLNDWHIPYHDKRALAVAFNFVESTEPEKIVIDEVVDFYALSKFSKDPKRRLMLQDELDVAQEWLWRLRKRFPKTEITMVESNHDRRLVKYLSSQAQELAYLRCLDFAHLLGLTGMQIKYTQNFIYKKVLFKHGDIVRRDSAMTAKAEFVKEGMAGASGHTHRAGVFYQTLRGGKYSWVECGCLCTLKPDYVEGTANWQQGIGLFTFEDGSDLYDPKVFTINKYKILWGSKTIGE